jgi:hypothetical protein
MIKATQPSFDRTCNPPKRQPSQYEQIFQNKTSLSESDRTLLSLPLASNHSLAEVESAVRSAVRLSAEDFALLTAENSPLRSALQLGNPPIAPELCLSTLSALYRWTTLASTMHWSISDLLRLQAISGIDPWADPDATLCFLDAAEQVRSSPFTISDLDILLRHVTNPEFDQKLEEDAIALFQKLTKQLPQNLSSESGETLNKILAILLSQGQPSGLNEQVTQIANILNGKGICIANRDSQEYNSTDGVALANGTTLKVSEVQSYLQPIAPVIGSPLEEIVAQLVETDKPHSTPGEARIAIIINDLAIALFCQPFLLNELTSTFRLSQMAVKTLLERLPVSYPSSSKAIPALVFFVHELRSIDLQNSQSLPQELLSPYVQLVKGAWLIQQFRWTDQELALGADVVQHPLNLLPLQGFVATPQSSQALFQGWGNLCDLKRLQERFAARGLSFWTAHTAASQADSMANGWGAIARYLEASEEDAKTLLAPELLAIQQPAQDALPKVWLRFLDALELVQYLGVAAENLKGWVADALTSEVSDEIRLTAAAKRGGVEWQKVASSLRNQLRLQQRAALVAYVAGQKYLEDPMNSDALSHRLLVDVEMGTEQKVSRIDLAIASVQTFVQRALLGYEQYDQDGQNLQVAFDASFETRWEWMKSYRTWRTNRELFLFPENWLLPETRDDQSPFFVEFAQALSQRDLTDESVEDAFIAYLQKLDEVARMEIMGTCIEVPEESSDSNQSKENSGETERRILHIVARTQGIPHQYYHCTWALDTQHFSTWNRLDLDIDGDWAVPVILNGRLNLYWIKHTKQLESMKDVLGMNPLRPFPLSPHYPIYQDQYTLSWSTRKRRGWTPKRTADHYIARPFFPFAPAHFAVRIDGTAENEDQRILIGGVGLNHRFGQGVVQPTSKR